MTQHNGRGDFKKSDMKMTLKKRKDGRTVLSAKKQMHFKTGVTDNVMSTTKDSSDVNVTFLSFQTLSPKHKIVVGEEECRIMQMSSYHARVPTRVLKV